MDACTFEEPSANEMAYGNWTRAKIVREFYDSKPPTNTPGVRRRAATVRQHRGEGEEERGPHTTSEGVDTRSLMSQSQPGICDLTSRQLERSRTLESRHSRNTPLPFCQMVPESRQTQMIFPRQGAHSVNSGSEDAFTLEELNNLGLKRNPEDERASKLESLGKKQKHDHVPLLNIEEAETETLSNEATTGKGLAVAEGSQKRRIVKARKTTYKESIKPENVRSRAHALFDNANLIEELGGATWGGGGWPSIAARQP
ncbi:unnamed protein product [Prunus armeniaca]